MDKDTRDGIFALLAFGGTALLGFGVGGAVFDDEPGQYLAPIEKSQHQIQYQVEQNARNIERISQYFEPVEFEDDSEVRVPRICMCIPRNDDAALADGPTFCPFPCETKEGLERCQASHPSYECGRWPPIGLEADPALRNVLYLDTRAN